MEQAIPSLGQRLSWIWLICGIGLLLMGLSSSWNDAAFTRPNDKHLHSFTGVLQQATYSAPAKSPTLVELIIYNKKDGFKHGYLRYGLHRWEERLKPYLQHTVTITINNQRQIWEVQSGLQIILSSSSIQSRLQNMKKAQQNAAENIVYAGLVMVLFWLFVLRKVYKVKQPSHS